MSGGPDDKQAILAGMLRAEHLTVTTDAAIALSGATATGQGIAAIAGTGSVAFGRNAEGRTARTGGWGYVFGDEGSAFDIARQAVRAALRMEEGWGPPTSLRQALLDATGSRNANEVLHLSYTSEWPRSRVARLAPLADAAAAEGDAMATVILNRAAIEIALLVAAVRSQLWKPGEAVEVPHAGGTGAGEPLPAAQGRTGPRGAAGGLSRGGPESGIGLCIERYEWICLTLVPQLS
jgi:N-acetylglucosamine kinase